MTGLRKYWIRIWGTALLATVVLFPLSLSAQTSTMGRDFWVAFLWNFDGSYTTNGVSPQEMKLIAAGAEDADITVTIGPPSLPIWTQSTHLTGGNYVEITLPDWATADPDTYIGVIENHGIHVTSTADISLYASNRKVQAADITTVLPTSALRTHYITQDYPGSDIITPHISFSGSEIAIVATEDGTELEVTLAASDRIHPAGSSFPLTINAGYSYKMLSPPGQTLSGTEIKVTNGKPIAVFQGTRLAYVPTNIYNGEHLYDQATPVDYWGKDFVLVSDTRNYDNRVRITAAENGTVLGIDGSQITTLAARQTYEYVLPQHTAHRLTSTKPVMACHYLPGAGTAYWIADGYGDPSQVTVPPVDQGVCSAVFAAINNSIISDHYANIVTPTVYVNGMTLDGQSIASQFSNLDGEYSYARISVAAGTHTLGNSMGKFSAIFYGLGIMESYAYTTGMALKTLNRDTVIYDTVDDVDLPKIFQGDAHYLPVTDSIYHLTTVAGGDSTIHYNLHINHPASCAGGGSAGRDFWVGFLHNGHQDQLMAENGYTWIQAEAANSLLLKATAGSACMVTASCGNWSSTVNVAAGGSATIQVPFFDGADTVAHWTRPGYSRRIHPAGIHVTATADIELQAFNHMNESGDATMVLPTSTLGTYYMLHTYTYGNHTTAFATPHDGGEFCIVATEDNTTVRIKFDSIAYVDTFAVSSAAYTTVSSGYNTYPSGSYFRTLTMQQGDYIQLLTPSSNVHGSFTGTEIESDKPVAVFMGSKYTEVPFHSVSGHTYTYPNPDHLYEQVVPTSVWGTDFLIAPDARINHHWDYFGILSNDDDNTIYFTRDPGVPANQNNGPLHLRRGQLSLWNIYNYYDASGHLAPVYVHSTKPVAIYLYMSGGAYNNSHGDPSVVYIAPLNQGTRYATFNVSNIGLTTEHYASVVVPNDAVGAMRLDGNDISALFSAFVTTGYSQAQVPLTQGTHTLSNAQGKFNAWVYGLGPQESYAYTAAASFCKTVNEWTVNGLYRHHRGDTLFICHNDTLEFSVTPALGYDSIGWYIDGMPQPPSTPDPFTLRHRFPTMTDNHSVMAVLVAGVAPAYRYDTLSIVMVSDGSRNTVEGATPSLFSVSSTHFVRFSPGNLQFQASTRKWRFAPHQYDYIGTSNSSISSTYSGWIDLFGYGTSGWNSGATAYQPWSTSITDDHYQPGNNSTNTLTGAYAEADWAWHNAIIGGGNETHVWRTLTNTEWDYLINERDSASYKHGSATVNSIHGLVLLPDYWQIPAGLTFVPGMNGWSSNTYTTAQWEEMENAGAIFLPAAGNRKNVSSISKIGTYGYYWTVNNNGSTKGISMLIGAGSINSAYAVNRYYGFSLRPVYDVYSDTVASACDSFTWYDSTYTASTNTATHTFTNASGCDSVVTLHLTIHHSNTGTDVQTACDSYTWIDGNTYTASNSTATHTINNIAGCDSIVTLNLTINQSSSGTDIQTACDSFLWIDGNTYTDNNSTATHTLTNAEGCDSTVTLNLTVNHSSDSTITVLAFSNELPMTVGGTSYTNFGYYQQHLTNAVGCDSTLNITIIPYPDNVDSASCTIPADSNAFEMVKLYESGLGAQTYSTPLVADLDGDGLPEIIVPKAIVPVYNRYTNEFFKVYKSDGLLILNGQTGELIRQIQLPNIGNADNDHPFDLAGQAICIADVDNDHQAEIFILTWDRYLYCYSHTGTLRWQTSFKLDYEFLPTVADLMGDGHVQVICGNYIFNATNGTLLLHGDLVTNGTGLAIHFQTSMLASTQRPNRMTNKYMPAIGDIDGDGTLEIAAGRAIYKPVITNYLEMSGNSWSTLRTANDDANITYYDGRTILLDFDTDGDLDVCVIATPNSWTAGDLFTVTPYVWDGQTSNIVASNNYTLTIGQGPSIPYCGDLDGDGKPEIVFAIDGNNNNTNTPGDTDGGMFAYTYDPSQPTHMRLMHRHAPFGETAGFTVFDFNQDGHNELIYRGTEKLFIVDGATLDTLCTPITAYSGTLWEYPVVADVNGDGNAEIIVTQCDIGNWPTPSYPLSNYGGIGRVVVYGSAIPGAWSSARKVWNEYAYNGLNINEDLTVPQHPISPATRFPNGTQPYNKFLGQVPYINRQGDMFNPVADAVANSASMGWDGNSADITLNYHNQGDNTLFAPYGITVYKNAYRGDIVWIDTVQTDLTVGPNGSYTFGIPRNVIYAETDLDSLVIAVNDLGTGIAQHGGQQPECDTTNNTVTLPIQLLRANDDYVTIIPGVPVDIFPTINDSLPCNNPTIIPITYPHHGTRVVHTSSYNHEGYDNRFDDLLGGSAPAILTGGETPRPSITYYQNPGLFFDPTYTGLDSMQIVIYCGPNDYDTSWIHILIQTPTDTFATACNSFNWYDSLYTVSGNYYHLLPTAGVFDSILLLHLTVGQNNVFTDVQTACDSYTWIDGNTYTESNTTATHTLTNVAGCDSVVTLNLTINHSNTDTDIQTACDNYTWIDGNTYTDNNSTATYTLTNTASCDSVVTLHLTVNHSNTGDTTAVACDSFVWWNTNYTNSTDAPTHTYTNAAGCDSVVTLHLTVNHSNTGDTAAVACDSFTWWGTDYTGSTDAPTHAYANAGGCDSVVTLHLTVNSSATSNNEATVHDTITANLLPYTWNGIVFNTPAEDTVAHAVNVAGCDSLIHYYLHVRNAVCVDTTVAYGYEDCLHAPIYGMHGDYQQRVQSIYQPYLLTHLVGQTIDSLHYDLAYMQNSSWCNQTWVISVGTATRNNLYSSFDNDAVLTEVYRGPLQATSSGGMGIKLDSSFTYNGGRLLIQFTNATSGNGYASTLFNGLTPDYAGATRWATTYYGGDIMTLSGTREDQLPMVTFHYCRIDTTFLRPPIDRFFDTTIMACDSLVWNNHTLTVSGTYRDTIVTADNHDSLVTLHLTINHSSTFSTEGAVKSYFSVDSAHVVEFSKGNLQYQASTDTWRFAEHQYDIIGNNNSHISSTYNGWIDLFGWGCSGWNSGANAYQPYSTSTTASDYYPDGAHISSLTGENAEADWAWHNVISNGGNQPHLWRTPTHDEWQYLFNERTTVTNLPTPNARYAKAKVNNVYGVILFPDKYTHPADVATPVGINATDNTGMYGNIYNVTTWNKLEEAGAVFLPVPGYRNGTSISMLNQRASYYASSVGHFSNSADGIAFFFPGTIDLTVGLSPYCGNPVRPIKYLTKVKDTVITACNDYTWHGTGYHATGEYFDTLTNVQGCDSIFSLRLTIYNSDNRDTTDTVCNYTRWYDQTLYESGDYTHTLYPGSIAGCDSTVTLHLTVKNSGFTPPEGATQFLFSVGANNTVLFSPGNLQYQPSTGTWRFAEHQYDYMGSSNGSISSTYSGWIDLFGWATSGWNSGATAYQPYSTSQTNSDYHPGGTYTHDLTESYAEADWAWHNPISNGGSYHHIWRTLTSNEWIYLLNTRTTFSNLPTSDARYAKARVKNTYGLIIFPDKYTHPDGIPQPLGINATNNTGWSGNYYNESQWESMEAAGAVFLPAAGDRKGTSIYRYNTRGNYWSSTHDDDGYAMGISFTNNLMDANVGLSLYYGAAVRPVVTNPFDTSVTACDHFHWYDTTLSASTLYSHPFTTTEGCDSVVTLHLAINHTSYGDTTATGCDSLLWHNSTYTASATYLDTLTNAAGCDSLITLNLTINNPVHVSTSETACDSYIWNSQNYSTSGDYTYSHADANGCIQVDTLHLTINHPNHIATTETACDSYIWNGQNYTSSGDYTYSHADANGCPQVDTLHLTINLSNAGTETVTACDNYTWHSNAYTASNHTATYTETNAAGCDSVVTLNLTINYSNTGTETITDCDSYNWHSTVYTASNNTTTYTETNAAGCDSVVTLNLTINHSTTGDTTATVCDNYTWIDGNTYTASTTAHYTLPTANAAGCDSTVTLHLTVNTSTSSTIHEEDIENNLPHWFNGHPFTADTTGATIVIPNTDGCDSTIHYSLTVHWNNMTNDDSTVCASSLPLTWNGVLFTSAGTQPATLAGADGADSVVSMTLHVNPVYHDTMDQSICDNQIYTFEGVTYNSADAGLHPHLLQTAVGCDSLRVLRLAVRSTSTGDTTAVACDSFFWSGQWVVDSGQYADTLTNAAGCDSVVTLHLTINSPVHVSTSETACDSYIWNGQNYTSSGDYTYSHADANGCIQVDTLHLTINHPNHIATTETACDSYTWNGQNYTSSGDYTYSHADANGCPQVDTLHLTINHSNTGTETVTACDNYTWHSNAYTASNHTATYTETNAAGCDSVVTLNLTVNHSSTSDTTATVCDSLQWHGLSLYNTGDTLWHSTNAVGCDSTVTLHLTVNTSTSSTIHEEDFENNLPHWFNGHSFTADTTGATIIIPNTAGCDSTIHYSLTVHWNNMTNDDSTVCASSLPLTWNGVLFTSAGTQPATLVNADGADSVVSMTLHVNPVYHDTVEQSICDNQIYTFEGVTYNGADAGFHPHLLQTAVGCDSLRVLRLAVHATSTGDTTAVACDSFIWIDGNTYTASTTTHYTLPTANSQGCDSTVTLNLTINYSNSAIEDVTACNSYVWHGNTYTATTNTPTFISPNAAGCDSVTTLNLTINYCSTTNIVACDTFTWHGTQYAASGQYIDGSDTLNLTINHSTTAVTLASECDSFTWIDGNTYTASTTAHYTLPTTNSQGCDSTVTLHLTVNHSDSVALNISACDSYTWDVDGNTYLSDTTLSASLLTSTGCDSLITLHLAILPSPILQHIPDTVINQGQSLTLHAHGADMFTWRDVNGTLLCNDSIFAVSPNTSTVYYLTAFNQGNNLVYNGDFELGNTGFTTAYTYSTNLNPAGYYCVGPNAHNYHYGFTGAHDHTSGSGNYMIVNGSGNAGTNLWTQTVTVQPYTDYAFSVWGTNVSPYSQPYMAMLQFSINGSQIGDIFQLPTPMNTWTQFYEVWNSGPNTSATITILNMNTLLGGNDFGIDDISFSSLTTCQSYDTVNVFVGQHVDSIVCDNQFPFLWNGQLFLAPGAKTATLTGHLGQDSIVIMNVVAAPTRNNELAVTTCDSFVWNADTYTTTGDYLDTLTTTMGCDSVVTMHLTVNHSTTGDSTAVACDSFFWNGQWIVSSGQYTDTLTNAAGCDSIVTLNLTINHSNTGTETVTACNRLVWHGTEYTISTDTPTYTTLNAVGCDSVTTLHLTVNQCSATTVTTCDSYTWLGNIYTTSGTYIDGNDTLYLTVNHSTASDTMATVCDSYTWIDGNTYTASTTANYTLSTTNSQGCDSVVTLHLTVNHSDTSDTTVVACDHYSWHGTDYTVSATPTLTFTNASGCDSVVTLNLTINHSNTGDASVTACDSYTWIDGNTYIASTTTDYTLPTANSQGCDSTVTLNLTINHSNTATETITACDSYNWHGTEYTTSNSIATHTETNTAGCDSVTTLDLTVNYSSTGTETVTACNSFVWHGTLYTASTNSPTYTSTNAAGCDSITTLSLTVNYCSSTDITACDTFSWHGTQYTTSGQYYDGTDTLNLTINHSNSGDTIANACNLFTWWHTDYTNNTDDATHTFTNAAGCDSVVTLHLTIRQSTASSEVQTVCDNYNWFNGETLTATGTYFDTITNASGCDSVVSLQLTVNHSNTGTDIQTACDSMQWIDSNTYTSSTQNSTFTIQNSLGCDSVVTLHLTINHSSAYTDTHSVCDSYTWIDGITYTASNSDASYTLTNTEGCDSVVTLHLTLRHSTDSTVHDTVVENSLPHSFNGLSLTDSVSNLAVTLTNAAGCDSVIDYSLYVHRNAVTILDSSLCNDGLPITWNGIVFDTLVTHTATMTRQLMLTTQGSADSTVVMRLTVHPIYDEHLYDTLYEGDTYSFEGTLYDTTGIYPHLLQTVAGCDSLRTLHLQYNRRTYLDSTLCSNQLPLLWNGLIFTEQGVDSLHLSATDDRDSLIVMRLSVLDTSSYTAVVHACDSLVWIDGNTYTQSNFSSRFTIPNSVGCDSVVTLQLTIDSTHYFTDHQEICDSIQWVDGEWYSEDTAGVTTIIPTVAGCDSVVTLELFTGLTVTSELYDTMCYNDTYSWHNLTAIGTDPYQMELFALADTLRTLDGCDSVVTMHLTKIAQPRIHFVDTTKICSLGQYSILAEATAPLTPGGEPQPLPYLVWSSSPTDTLLDGHENDNPLYVSPQAATAYTLFADYSETYTCPTRSSITLLPLTYPEIELKVIPEALSYNHLDFTAIDITKHEYKHRIWYIDGQRQVETGRSIIDRASFDADSVIVTLELYDSLTANSCSGIAVRVIPVNRIVLYAPNIFTPTRDDNNHFDIITQGVISGELYIYNREGLLIYYTSDYTNGWDGHTSDGTLCIQSAYVWKLIYRTIDSPESNQIEVGTVTLIR